MKRANLKSVETEWNDVIIRHHSFYTLLIRRLPFATQNSKKSHSHCMFLICLKKLFFRFITTLRQSCCDCDYCDFSAPFWSLLSTWPHLLSLCFPPSRKPCVLLHHSTRRPHRTDCSWVWLMVTVKVSVWHGESTTMDNPLMNMSIFKLIYTYSGFLDNKNCQNAKNRFNFSLINFQYFYAKNICVRKYEKFAYALSHHKWRYLCVEISKCIF